MSSPPVEAAAAAAAAAVGWPAAAAAAAAAVAVAVEVPRANVLVVEAAVVSWADVTVRGGGLGCAREMSVRMLSACAE